MEWQWLQLPHDGCLPSVLDGQLLHSLHEERVSLLQAHALTYKPTLEAEGWREM